jgi:hypothetical protein
MKTKGGDKSVVSSYPSLSHILISANLIAGLRVMYSDVGYTTDGSESCSDSESDHANEAAGPLQGNSPEIYCVCILLYCLPYAMLQIILLLFSSSFILLLNDIFTNICGHAVYINFL